MAKASITLRTRTNRLNAMRSTGPQSLIGKSKSSRNALKHGLSTALHRSPNIDERIKLLAAQLVKQDASEIELIAAQELAISYLELQRVGATQLDLWTRLLEGQTRVPVLLGASIMDDPIIRETLDPVARQFISTEPLTKSDLRFIQRIENFAIRETGRRPNIIHELTRLDRYERRARSKLARAKKALIEIQRI